jgi:hypothetical protein
VHAEIFRLKALPGVLEAVNNIERGFHKRLATICSPEELQRLYELNQVPPGAL